MSPTRLLLLAIGSVLSWIAAPAAEPEAPSRPNVLLILSDDLNHWVAHLGRNPQAITPNIDRLAARGVTFKHAYATAPVCNPSRASFMSGRRPYSTGVYNNSNDSRGTIPVEQSLVTVFRNAGYGTFGAGKIYHGGYDRRSEWEDYFDREGRLGPEPKGNKGVGGIRFGAVDAKDEDLSDNRIVDYGIRQLEARHERPFFLSIGLHKPHMPWYVPKKYFDLYPLDQIQLPPVKEGDLEDIPPAGVKFAQARGDHAAILKSGRWKEAVQAYLAAVSYADAQVGRLLDSLEKSAYADNTVVVLLGDHGWHFGEKEHWRKFALWEESTRAPYIWAGPGVKAGGVSERTVDFLSLFPTLTDLAGIPAPAFVEGKSIRPLLSDPSAAWEDPAITTHEFNNHAVRTENWRYIRYANGDEELYDEKADPYEWNNLASDPARASVKQELAALLPTSNAPEIPRRQKRANQPKAAAEEEPAEETAKAPAKPNIIYILADDLGSRDVSWRGGEIKTPNLDALAEAGAKLDAYYVQPVCSPTRAALMTGRYPFRYGFQSGVVRPWARYGLPLEERILPQALKEAGYETAISGKWHLGHVEPAYLPTKRGFDHQYGHYNGAIDYFTHDRDGGLDWHRNDQALREEGYSTELIASEAVKRIKERDSSKPLFLYVPFNGVHSPWQVPKRYEEAYSGLPGNRKTYAGMIAALDEAVGRISLAIQEAGIKENTLVIFSSDNGGPNPGALSDNGNLRAGKGTVFEGGVRVAAFATWPAAIPAGTTIEAPIHISDWYPTLLKLTGSPLEQALPVDGVDILPLLTGAASSAREEILVNTNSQGGALRKGKWKYIVQSNPKGKREAEELYDLETDLSESRNLAAENPETLAELRARYQKLAAQAVAPKSEAKPKGFVSPKVWGEADAEAKEDKPVAPEP